MQNSNSIADEDEKVDTLSLEDLPLEIFCLIVKDMPITDILAIASSSKSLKFKADSDTLWEQLIHRDFGHVALSTFHGQKRLPSGITAAKLYYKFLFEVFEAKIKDYMKFLKSYEIYAVAQSSRQDPDFIQFDLKLKQFANHLENWVASNLESRLKTVKECYSLYLKAISKLASGENQSFRFRLPPLVHAIDNRLSLTAIALISLPEVNVNQYTNNGQQDSIILDAIGQNKDEAVVHALLDRADLNLFVKNYYDMNPLESAHSKELKTKVLYKMLCAAGADGAYKILPFTVYSGVRKKDVFQYMVSLVKNSTSTQEKLKILYFSIAKRDVNYCSALSYYFHEIKSPHDIVRKVKILICVLEKSLASEVPLNIKHPETIWKDLADWAVDEPKDFMWRIRNESYIEDLEEKEGSCFDVDGLNTDMDDCDEYKAAEVAVDATICHETDDDHRFAIALVNAMFDNSAKQTLNQFKLQTLGFAVLGIGVGLAFGLGLGLGAHVHIAITVLSSVISAALTFVLSASYNYHRFMGPEPTATNSSTATYRPSVVANTSPGNNQQSTETSMTNRGIQELDPGSGAGKKKLSFQS